MLLEILAIGCLLVISVNGQQAFSYSCYQEHISLEEAFIRSDVVFLGVPGDRQASGAGYEFEVLELYKAPEEFLGKRALTVTLTNAQYHRSFSQVFVFANFTESDGVTYLLSPQCGMTMPTPQARIQRYKRGFEKEESGAWKDEHRKLTFTGNVLSAKHVINQNKPSYYKKWKAYTNSEITFEISEWIGGGHPDPNFKQKTNILVKALGCGSDYDVGQEYLVSAYPQPMSDEQGRRSVGYIINCEREESGTLLAKEILRDLSPIYKNEENISGD